jgi:hypothetical protein
MWNSPLPFGIRADGLMLRWHRVHDVKIAIHHMA